MKPNEPGATVKTQGKYLKQLSGHLELSAFENISVAEVLLFAGATGEPFSKATTETLYPTLYKSVYVCDAPEKLLKPGLVLSQEPWKVTLEVAVSKSMSEGSLARGSYHPSVPLLLNLMSRGAYKQSASYKDRFRRRFPSTTWVGSRATHLMGLKRKSGSYCVQRAIAIVNRIIRRANDELTPHSQVPIVRNSSDVPSSKAKRIFASIISNPFPTENTPCRWHIHPKFLPWFAYLVPFKYPKKFISSAGLS